MKLYIQNMVCLCCRTVVATELNNMNLLYSNLELGEVQLLEPITKEERAHLKKILQEYGLEIMENEKAILVEKIVTIIVNMIHHSDELPFVNFSVYLTNQLNQDYHTLSTLFSQTKGDLGETSLST